MTLLRQIRYLTLRSIRARWLRFVLSAFGIILGVAGMLAIGVTNKAALNSIVRLFANTSGSAKLTISSSSQSSSGFPEQTLRTTRNIPNVSIASPIIRVNTVAADDASPEQIAIGLFGTEFWRRTHPARHRPCDGPEPAGIQTCERDIPAG